MKLLGSTTSPFVRKVRVALLEKQLEVTLDGLRPTPLTEYPELRAQNPLAKIPALQLDDGTALYDSRVILEYLEALVPTPALLPASGAARWSALRQQALADGILEAGIAVFYELSFRPQELHWQPWWDAQLGKASAGLDALEREAATWSAAAEGPVHLGQIAVVSMLDWLVFRKALDLRSAGPLDLAQAYPQLWQWFEHTRQRASFAATQPAL